MLESIVIIDRPGQKASVRAALEHMVLFEWLYAAGKQGPNPHVHRLHTDCFYVIRGALTLSLADGDRTVGPGTTVLIPPNVVHTFRNDGPDEVLFLNIHAPGVSFDRYLRESQGLGETDQIVLAERYDQYPAPESGSLDPAAVIVRTARTDAVCVEGLEVGFLLDADETLGAIGLIELTMPPSSPGLPARVHADTCHVLYVLEGQVAVRSGDGHHVLEAGDGAVVPPGIVYGLSNATDTQARLLDVHAPGGFERFFRECAAAANGLHDPATMAEIASRYDMKLM